MRSVAEFLIQTTLMILVGVLAMQVERCYSYETTSVLVQRCEVSGQEYHCLRHSARATDEHSCSCVVRTGENLARITYTSEWGE